MVRPKSATLRTADVVGLDTLVHVENGVHASGVEDEQFKGTFVLPDYINFMMENKWLGLKPDKVSTKSEKC